MFERGALAVSVLSAALLSTIVAASAFDETKYPDLKGQWRRGPNAITGVAQGRANVFEVPICEEIWIIQGRWGGAAGNTGYL